MNCSNCGNKLEGNEEFCSSCGTNLKELKEYQGKNLNIQEEIVNQDVDESVSNNETLNISKSSLNQTTINSNINKKETFIAKHKKKLCAICFGLILITVGIVLFNHFIGFEKLSWNNEYPDTNLMYVAQTNLKLGINFSNEDKIDQIKYSSTCGEIENKGLEVKWNLTEAIGKCQITVSYKTKQISKEYTVIPFDIEKHELFFDEQIDLDSDEDLDFDNLTNKQEKEYGTNPLLSDTDMDGLDDDYEILNSKTDPNKEDTDEDGLSDFDEIKLGLDPLKADSKSDGQKDGDRILTYDYTNENVKLSITGKGNIASTISEVSPNTKISNKKGLIDNLYTFYTEGKITEAIVTIPYTNEDLEKYGLTEDNLSIYYYNEKESKYEKVETTIDKENKTLTAKLNHFSNYVVGDSTIVKTETTTQILFVLDNSWSMYSNEQYEEITGQENDLLEGFDKEGVRFSLTSDLVSKLSQKGYQMGLSEFRNDYANALKIGSDANAIKTKLNGMNGNFITSSAGTNISNALTKGISEFSKDIDNKFIVILTDGQDSSLSNKTKTIIETATKKDVKICSIGFGGGSYNTELSNISNSTGCKFYSSSNVNGLTELFENVGAELDDDLIDINGDGTADGILVADSGFVVNRDGFSFENYETNKAAGHCYGMATFAELYYKKVLPLTINSITSGNSTSYAYNLNNTYFKDYANLYDYNLKTNALKYDFGFSMFGEELPSDIYTVENDSLMYSSKYRSEIENSGIYEFTEAKKSNLNSDEQMEIYGFTYSTFIGILLNEDKMQTSNILNNDDKQMFNAIYTSFIKQLDEYRYSSATNFTLWARNVVGTETTDYTGANGFINILKARLNDQDAPVIASDYNGGLHAINAISLIQNIENPNYYYIGVYDNNYPGEKRYVDVKCNNNKCVTKANGYYSRSDQPIRITPSLEYDLEYFNR